MIGNHQAQIKDDGATSRRKLWVTVAIVVAVIVLAGVSYLWYQHGQDQPAQADELLVDRAAQAMIDGDLDVLQETAREIQRKSDYREVAEYTYIVARAQIEARQMDEASETIEDFRSLKEASDDGYVGLMSSLSHDQMLTQLERNYENMQVIIRAEERGVGETMGG